MLSRTTRSLPVTAGAALATLGLLLAGAPSADAATTAPSTVGLYASAYGSTASVGPLGSGRTASFSACSTTPGTTYGSTVAATDLGGVLGRVGAVVTKGTRSGDSVRVTSTAGATTLLGGLVQATAITSTSTSATAGTTLSSTGSTVVTGLRVAGLPVTVPAGVGSHLDVPGVATLTFNQQTTRTSAFSRQLTVDALRVDLLPGNRLGLATGSIVVGSSTSGASVPTRFVAGGSAYGTAIYVGSLAVAGPSAYLGMGCGGTGGTVTRNKVASLSLPGVATTGLVTSTAQSIEGDGRTTAVLGSTVAGVDLLGGAVTADAVTARATTTRTATGVTSTDDGTSVTNLRVLGAPVTLGAKPNSSIDVAGLGTLTVRRTVRSADGLDVTGLELRLSADRLGVKAGTVVKVAAARSRVTTT